MNQPDMKSKARRWYAVGGILVIVCLLFAYYMGDQASSVASSASFTIDTRDADTEVRGTSLLAAKDSAFFTIDTLDPDSVTQARSLASSEASGFFTIDKLDPDTVSFAISQAASEWSGFFTIDTMADSSTRAESGYFIIDTMDPDALTRAVSLSASEESGWFTINTLDPPPVISTAPTNLTIMSNDRAQLRVNATGTGTLSYQWYRGESGVSTNPIDGAIKSMYTTPSLTATSTYWVKITDSAGSNTNSGTITVTVALTSPITAIHAVVGPGYLAGGTVTITNTITYTGTPPSRIDWATLIPPRWAFLSSGGSDGNTKPQTNTTDLLEWSWTAVPAGPITFTYTVSVPPGMINDAVIASLVTSQQSGTSYQSVAKPDPLVVRSASTHSADADRNGRISLVELTRVIELYNTRLGTTRTGRYKVQTGTEDGYAQDPVSETNQPLSYYHSADSDRNGQLALLELTRVIELYNVRSGTVRTGQYHVQAGTEDGFAPGP